MKAVNIDILRAGDRVEHFFDENIKEKVRVLAEVLIKRKEKDKSKISHRSEDPDWFSGILLEFCSRKYKFKARI